MKTLMKEGIQRGTRSLREGYTGNEDLIIPTNNDELWEFINRYLNIQIPRIQICETHCAPFDAVADAFFARDPISVWKASRGFGGKSFNLAALSLTEALLMMKVNLLGGSGEQSERVLNYIYGQEVDNVMLEAPDAPTYLVRGGLEKGTLKKKTDFTHSGYLRALMASSRSVRGPHPERLRLDEIDEMDLSIFDSAMGQTMSLREFEAQTVASSTWHNANGTMTEILKRADDKGWPVYEWCYLENLESNGGWLPDKEVEAKRNTVTTVMFNVEYDLQEPNPESRAIDSEAVAAMFNKELGEFKGHQNEKCEIEGPVKGTVYIMGTDFAKRQDWTINLVYKELEDYWDVKDLIESGEDTQEPLLRLVNFSRTGRAKWPVLVGRMELKYRRYGEQNDIYSCHDETGIGDVIADYMSEDVSSEGIWMAGRIRYSLLTDYISAVEHGYIECPDIEWMRKEHEHASDDDVFGTGTSTHLPDTIAAAALAWYIFKNKPRKTRVRATWGS